MTNKIALFTTLVCVFASGCASHSVRITDPVVTLDQDHRVIRHNFKNKYDIVEAKPIKQDHQKQGKLLSTSSAPSKQRCKTAHVGCNKSTTIHQKTVL